MSPNDGAASTNDHPIGVTIRRLDAADSTAVARLAQRDTAPPPAGPLLGAEAEGRLLAAVSTNTGEVIADPFFPTAEIVEVLRLRARQLDRRPRARLVTRLLAGTRGGARPAPSPPGAGGRLLSLSGRPAR